MERMLENMRKLNWLLQKSGEGAIPFDEMCEIISRMILSDVYVVSRRGKVLGRHAGESDEPMLKEDPTSGMTYIPQKDISGYMKLDKTHSYAEDVPVGVNRSELRKRYRLIVPVLAGDRRLGTMILSRFSGDYNTEEIIYAEYGAVMAGIDMEMRINKEIEIAMRKRTSSQMAIGALTYTEIDAVKQVFGDMHGDEELIVPNKVAEKYGFSVSAIKSAIKSLDSFGVIEARSIGMKGSRVRIVNETFREELEKIEI